MSFSYSKWKWKNKNNYYPRYKSITYKGTSKRRALNNFKAAKNQSDSTNIVLNVPAKISCSFYHNNIPVDGVENQNITFNSGVYALNIWDLLRRSTFYQSYASMYDQVKITGVKVKLTPVSWTFNTQAANAQNGITVVTAWDRTGLSTEQVKILKQHIIQTPGTQEAGQPDPFNKIGTRTGAGATDGLYINMNDEVFTYSSSYTKQLNPGSSFNTTRSIYPESLAEKSFFANTADLEKWYGNYDSTRGRYYWIEAPNRTILDAGLDNLDNGDYLAYLKTTNAISSNPCYIMEDSSIPFKPTLLVGCQGGVAQNDLDNFDGDDVDAVLTQPITFNVEADISVTFRGLRKAKVTE